MTSATAVAEPQTSTITISQVEDMADPKLKAIAKRALRSLQLEAEKAIANLAAPDAFPRTPAPAGAATRTSSSAEDVFAAWFQRLDPTKKQAATARVMASINAPQRQREAYYGDLAKVNMRLAVPMSDQVASMPVPTEMALTVEYLNSLTQLQGQILAPLSLQPTMEGEADGSMPAEQSASLVTNKLEFRIHKVKCLDETDPEFFGDDEISLGGTTVDQSGTLRKVDPFEVRPDFDESAGHNQQVYSPPKRFASFDLTAGTTFPKSYLVTLVLAETDMGGIADFINMLWEKTKGQVLALISSAVGGAIGSTVPGLGTIVGAAVGYVIGLFVNWLIGLLGDDVFPPFTTAITIPSMSHRFNGNTDSPNASAIFKAFGGKYQVVFDWRLFA